MYVCMDAIGDSRDNKKKKKQIQNFFSEIRQFDWSDENQSNYLANFISFSFLFFFFCNNNITIIYFLGLRSKEIDSLIFQSTRVLQTMGPTSLNRVVFSFLRVIPGVL